MGAISRVLRPKTKLLTVKFSRILEVLRLQGLQKLSGRIFVIYMSKNKLFALKFRRILEVLFLQVFQKKFWAQFHDFCIQMRSCLLLSSDAF